MIRALHDDRGQSLVMVILFISVFATMIPVVSGAASSGIISSRKQADLARDRDAADAGAEYALRRVMDGAAGSLGSAPVSTAVPASVNGSSVNVTVTRRAVTGLTLGGPTCLWGSEPVGHYTVTITDDGRALPYGAQLTVSPAAAGLDQGGRFAPPPQTAAGTSTTYVITATLANLSATRSVTVYDSEPASPTPPCTP